MKIRMGMRMTMTIKMRMTKISMTLAMPSRSLLSKSNDELNHKYGLIGDDRRRSTILDDQPSAKSRKVNKNV